MVIQTLATKSIVGQGGNFQPCVVIAFVRFSKPIAHIHSPARRFKWQTFPTHLPSFLPKADEPISERDKESFSLHVSSTNLIKARVPVL
jgi:hypothetical protein